MKKILLSAMALMSMAAVQAQDVPYIFTEVEANTYAITMSPEDMAGKYDATWCEAAWNIGVAFPAETVMFENDKLTITAGTNNTPVYNQNNKISDIQKDFPSYTGYVNLGSNLPDKGWTGDEQIFDLNEWAIGNHGIVVVTPKVDGTLKFGVYAGDNTREIGIYKLDLENLEDFGWVSYEQFRNDGENGTVKNAPFYIEGEVKAGVQYALMAGSNKNLNMHQITFVPGTGTGIAGVETSAEKSVEAYYTLDGVRLNAPAKGVNIVKYTDGTTVKVVK